VWAFGCQAVGVHGEQRPVSDQPVSADAALVAARMRLADRVAGALVERVSLPGWLDEVMINTRIAHAPQLRQVVLDAAWVARSAGEPALMWRQEPATGLVVRLHGESWSLVFRICGNEDIPVLVLSDTLPGHAWRIDADEDWTPELLDMVNAVIDEIERRQYGQPVG
jgi:hypothetical protein